MILTVHAEWPSGSEDIEFEVDDDSTPAQILEAAQEAFFGVCNFGYSINGELQ